MVAIDPKPRNNQRDQTPTTTKLYHKAELGPPTIL